MTLLSPCRYLVNIESLNYKWGEHVDLEVYSGCLEIEPLRKSIEELNNEYMVHNLILISKDYFC